MSKFSRSGPRLLITHRHAAIYLERAKVRVDDSRVVYDVVDDDLIKTFNIPHVNLAVLFLGQGTSMTNEAARKLGEEGVHVAWSGTGMTPLHHGSLTTYQSTAHLRRFIPIYMDTQHSLEAAKTILFHRTKLMSVLASELSRQNGLHVDNGDLKLYSENLMRVLPALNSSQELLLAEAGYAKNIYRAFAKATGIEGFSRSPGTEQGNWTSNQVPLEKWQVSVANSLIDHGNYLLYGIAAASLWTLGIPPSMSVLHGKTRAGGLVFDIADGFKDSIVLPLAFSCVANASYPRTKEAKKKLENEFRAKIIETIHNYELLKVSIDLIDEIIKSHEVKVRDL